MASQEYSFPGDKPSEPRGGMTPQVADESSVLFPEVSKNLHRPAIPQLGPAIRGIAENAGFPPETLEGEALIAKTLGGAENVGALRDGDNAKSLGDYHGDYPGDLSAEAFTGPDNRHFDDGTVE